MSALDRLYLSPEFALIAVIFCISLLFFTLRVIELRRNTNITILLEKILIEKKENGGVFNEEIRYSEVLPVIHEKLEDVVIIEESVILEINNDAHARLVLNNKHLEKNFSFLTLDTNTFKEVWDYFRTQNTPEIIKFLDVILHFRPDSKIIRAS